MKVHRTTTYTTLDGVVWHDEHVAVKYCQEQAHARLVAIGLSTGDAADLVKARPSDLDRLDEAVQWLWDSLNRTSPDKEQPGVADPEPKGFAEFFAKHSVSISDALGNLHLVLREEDALTLWKMLTKPMLHRLLTSHEGGEAVNMVAGGYLRPAGHFDATDEVIHLSELVRFVSEVVKKLDPAS